MGSIVAAAEAAGKREAGSGARHGHRMASSTAGGHHLFQSLGVGTAGEPPALPYASQVVLEGLEGLQRGPHEGYVVQGCFRPDAYFGARVS